MVSCGGTTVLWGLFREEVPSIMQHLRLKPLLNIHEPARKEEYQESGCLGN